MRIWIDILGVDYYHLSVPRKATVDSVLHIALGFLLIMQYCEDEVFLEGDWIPRVSFNESADLKNKSVNVAHEPICDSRNQVARC